MTTVGKEGIEPRTASRLIYGQRQARSERDTISSQFQLTRSGQACIFVKSQLPILFSTEPGS